MSFNQEMLRRLQLTQLAIMKDIDAFCRKHDIRYSLYAGTLLGAVRHQGFIPWDDDLDICMPRADYDRFITLWSKEGNPRYLLQNKENTPGFTQSFTKIRKYDSDFYTNYDKFVFRHGKPYHTGIFVDIFPVDRLPHRMISGKMFMAELMLYQLMVHEFIPDNASAVVRMGTAAILKLTTPNMRRRLRHILLAHLCRNSNDRTMRMVTTETLDAARQIYSSSLFDRYTELPFEDCRFRCIEDWDQMLRVKFGNYLQLPPEEEREWKHKPITINFDHCRKEFER